MGPKTTSQKARSHKTPTQRSKRATSKAHVAPAYVGSMLSMAAQNVINMVTVAAVSGAVLFALLAARPVPRTMPVT
jgi:hypothetical protein